MKKITKSAVGAFLCGENLMKGIPSLKLKILMEIKFRECIYIEI